MATRTRRRVYVVAAPAFDASANDRRRVLTVLVDVAELEWDWIGGQPVVFFSGEDSGVFLSNRSELLFWQQGAGMGWVCSRREGPKPAFSKSQAWAGMKSGRWTGGLTCPPKALAL